MTTNPLFRLLGRRFVQQAASRHTTGGGALDLRFGLTLFKDRRVPIGSKLVALVAGVAATALLIALEIPLEGVIALALPVLGFVSDAVIDGLEAIAGPILIAALLLPRFAPSAIVQKIREEAARNGALNDPASLAATSHGVPRA